MANNALEAQVNSLLKELRTLQAENARLKGELTEARDEIEQHNLWREEAYRQLSRATHFNHGDGIEIIRCEGHRLPKSPMWKVARAGFTLNTDGEWEYEPIPSGRDADYYARNRYDTYGDAVAALDAARWGKEER